ncbi:MAG: SH3 domain-containing protein [Spirochaetaceae bacterium]|jgi:flagellar motor protein MotB|nr:SH3 domain-containing protein [Spirochaetaceae bacterium]
MKRELFKMGILSCIMVFAILLWSCRNADAGKNQETAQAGQTEAEAAQTAETAQPEQAAETPQPAQTAQNTIPYESYDLVFFMYDGSKLNVRESPDRSAKVVFQLDQPTSISSLELTAWKDTIGGATDRWVKIKMEDGRTGWVFGGFLGVERGGGGGPKYNIEEDRKEFEEYLKLHPEDEGI